MQQVTLSLHTDFRSECEALRVEDVTNWKERSMKTHFRIVIATALAAGALQAAAAALPQGKTENGVTFINGGVGHDEAAAMKAEARHYPLSMIFSAAKDNEFVAGVKLTIRDKSGKEILQTSAGPMMLLDVPAGSYAITADLKGRTLHRIVHVKSKGATEINFHWPKA